MSGRSTKSVGIQRARTLRRRQTTPEAALWQTLRNGKVAGLKFRRQHPIGRFIVDFCCESARLVVEIDGDSHAGDEAEDRDAERTAWLAEQGYRVARFTNEDIHKRLGAVIEAIFLECVRKP